VLSLAPDLLLAAPETGPEIALEQIAAAGVEIRTAPDLPGAAGIAPKIGLVGEALGRHEAADALAARVGADLAAVRAKIARIETRPRVLFILLLRGGAPVVGGSGTEAEEIIRLAGGENAAAAVDGYTPMTREAILAAQPEVIVMMQSRAEAAGGIADVLARPDIALTPAGREGRGVVMPGMLLLGFGPRTPEAIARLARALHPEGAAAAGL
jgi:iron complex transport system substrate-binding protein